MARKPRNRVQKTRPGTRQEIDQAISSLTHNDLSKLRKFAAWRMRALGRADVERDAEVLLQDAVTGTLAGCEGNRAGRRWNKRVDFVKHLTEVMRSISNHWSEQQKKRDSFSVLGIAIPNSEHQSPVHGVRSGEPSIERVLAAKAEVEEIFALFRNDEQATLVLKHWSNDTAGPKIIGPQFDKRQYEATVKRIRYAVQQKRA
jgi:hypothetical protein